jgi:hypothetical protein
MRTLSIALAAGMGLIMGAVPMLAHHSFAAEYDSNKPVMLDGVVTKVEWMNPHARFYIDVKDAAGKVVNWELELGSPNVLQREGWARESMKPGDHVIVNGFLAKDGSKLANARDVKLSDGRKVFAGSSAGGYPVN